MRAISTILRFLILLIGVGFVAIGLAGFFRPLGVAEALSLAATSPVGVGSIRVVVGAHYLAMGLTAVYAAVRRRPTLLIPLAAIETSVLAARIVAGFSGELSPTGMAATGVEVVASLIFILGITIPAPATSSRHATT